MLRRSLACFLLFLAVWPVMARDDGSTPVELRLDHAQLIRLPQGTATIVLGNPKIADITPQRNGLYVLTGKAFGSTNLIAQGGSGEILAAFVLRVLPNTDDSQMTVQRGMAQETLHCLPRCVPAENVVPALPAPAQTAAPGK